MRNNTIRFVSLTPIILGLSLLGGYSDKTNADKAPVTKAVTAQQPEDVVARVGGPVWCGRGGARDR